VATVTPVTSVQGKRSLIGTEGDIRDKERDKDKGEDKGEDKGGPMNDDICWGDVTIYMYM